MVSCRNVRLTASIFALLVCIVAWGSLFLELGERATADEPGWLIRYERFADDPFAVEDHVNPFAGMGNRVIVGLPGRWLHDGFGWEPLVAHRAVQLLWFAMAMGFLAAFLTSTIRCDFPGIAWHHGFFVLLIPLTFPLILAMARIINYDTISSLAGMLGLVSLARSVRGAPPDCGGIARLHPGWVITAGAFTGLACATKAYGIIVAAYSIGIMVVVVVAVVHPRWWARSAITIAGFGAVAAAVLFAMTPPMWREWSLAAHYNRVIVQGNLDASQDIMTTVAAALFGVLVLGVIAGVAQITPQWKHWVHRVPWWGARLLAVGWLVALGLAVIWQNTVLYLPQGQHDFPVVSQTAHIVHTFGTSSVWTERLLNPMLGLRILVYTLPLPLVLLLTVASVALFVRRELPTPTVGWTILVLAGFVLFFVAVAAYGRVLPTMRYYLPMHYSMALIGGLLLAAAAVRSPRFVLAFSIVSAAFLGVVMEQIAPHYHGYINALRSRAVENLVTYGERPWLWGGWGENQLAAYRWIQRQHAEDPVSGASDYLVQSKPGIQSSRTPTVQWPRHEYYIFQKNRTYRERRTHDLLTNLPPEKSFGYLGANSVFVYSRQRIGEFMLGPGINMSLPGDILRSDQSLSVWNLKAVLDEPDACAFTFDLCTLDSLPEPVSLHVAVMFPGGEQVNSGFVVTPDLLSPTGSHPERYRLRFRLPLDCEDLMVAIAVEASLFVYALEGSGSPAGELKGSAHFTVPVTGAPG